MTPSAFDINAIKKKYSGMDERELFAIASVDANQYELEALEAARGELGRRGYDEATLSERARDLKAQRYDELTSPDFKDLYKLPRWMFWVCLLESSTFSGWIVFHLLWKGRRSAAEGALILICIGWAIKAVLFFVIPSVWETNS